MRVIREQGSHRLIEQEGRYAVVEHRNDQVFAVRDAERDGAPDTAEGMAAVIGPDGWTDRETAERLLTDLVGRGEDLAKNIW